PWWERTLDLAGIDLGDRLVVEITGNTHVPTAGNPGQGGDGRALGVKVRAVKLLRQAGGEPAPPGSPAAPSFLDGPLGSRAVPGVEDSGFYSDEQNASGAWRWTDGKARLVIPLNRNERPQALWLQLHRPKNTWLRIAVNGRELVQEKAADSELH